MNKVSRFILFASLVIAVDQLTKIWVAKSFQLYESLPIIDNFFNLTYVLNSGAAFGFLAGVNAAWVQIFFISVGFIALGVILYIYKSLENDELLLQYTFILIFAGAVGNLIDRIARGEVIDFLDVYVGSSHWPAFNVADSAISIGMVLFVYDQIQVYRKEKCINHEKGK